MSTATRPHPTLITRTRVAALAVVAGAALSGCSLDVPGTTTDPGTPTTSPPPTATADPSPAPGAGRRTTMPLGGALTTAPGTRILGQVGTTGPGEDGTHGWYATLDLSPRTEPAAVVAFYRQQLAGAGFEITDSGPTQLRAFSANAPSGPEDANPDASGSSADGADIPGSTGSSEGTEGMGDAGSAAGSAHLAEPVQPGTYIDIDVARATTLVPAYVRILSTTR